MWSQDSSKNQTNRNVLVVEFWLTRVFMSTLYWKNWIQLLLIIILFKKLFYDKVWKFDIKNIYPKYIKVYTDIDPTVDCQQNRSRKQWKIVSQDKFEVNQMRIQKL